ncbi:MAG: hypothetical protein NC400_00735 [Clostridium sp.]|nr:hypothetical protein [Clostridium sp.]
MRKEIRKNMIEIAFCFDSKMAAAACVAIAGLLDFKRDEEIHYRISCICSKKAFMYKEKIENIVKKRDGESLIEFYLAPEKFNKAYEVRGISVSAYLRLLLHRILLDREKVIYADVDIFFQDNLKPVWDSNISNFLFAGVKGATNFTDTWDKCMELDYAVDLERLKGNYINSGLLFMNLEKIRKWNPDEKWGKMAEKKYYYQDQDILNITCAGKIKYLNLRYNVQAHLTDREFIRFAEEKIYPKEICMEAMQNPAVIHYTGPKPWDNRGVNRGKIWWDYVDGQEDLSCLFDKKKIPNRKTTGLLGKINRHLPF